MKHERAAYAGIHGEIEDRNDCAVRSVALACEIPYADAQRLLLRAGRWRHTGTYLWIIRDVLVQIKPRSEEWTPAKPIALRKFAARRVGTWIFYVYNHVAVLRDGTIHDHKPRPGERVSFAWRIK